MVEKVELIIGTYASALSFSSTTLAEKSKTSVLRVGMVYAFP